MYIPLFTYQIQILYQSSKILYRGSYTLTSSKLLMFQCKMSLNNSTWILFYFRYKTIKNRRDIAALSDFFFFYKVSNNYLFANLRGQRLCSDHILWLRKYLQKVVNRIPSRTVFPLQSRRIHQWLIRHWI